MYNVHIKISYPLSLTLCVSLSLSLSLTHTHTHTVSLLRNSENSFRLNIHLNAIQANHPILQIFFVGHFRKRWQKYMTEYGVIENIILIVGNLGSITGKTIKTKEYPNAPFSGRDYYTFR